MAENQIELLIKANDQASAQLNKITGQIKNLETGGGTASTSMDGLGKATGGTTSRILEFAGGVGIATVGIGAMTVAWSAAVGAFEKGIKSIDNLRMAQAAMAGAAATNDPSLSFEKAYNIAGRLVDKVQQLSATFVGTGDELAQLAQAMVTFGLGLDLSNEKAQKSFVSFANMFKIMTAGQEFSRQAMSEIRALATGQEVAGAMVIRNLEAAGINVKQMLPIWKEQGTLLENIMHIMSGYDQATGKIANTLVAQKTTLETITLKILREGTAGAYADILTLVTGINKSLMDQNGLTEKGKILVDGLKLSWIAVSTPISAAAKAMDWLLQGTIAYYNVTKNLVLSAKDQIFGGKSTVTGKISSILVPNPDEPLKLPPSASQLTEAQLKAAEHIQKMVEDLADKISVERAMARGGEVEAAFEKARIDWINRNRGVRAAAEAAGKAADMEAVNLALRLSDEQRTNDEIKALEKQRDAAIKITQKTVDEQNKIKQKAAELDARRQEKFLELMDKYNESMRQAQERMPRPWDMPGAKEREREMHDFITEQNNLEALRRKGEAGLPGGIDAARYGELMDKLTAVHRERMAQIEDTTSVATARIAQLWVDMAGTMDNAFGTIFMDAFHGQLKTLGDYFNLLAEGIAAAWSRAMANMLTEWIQTQARMKASEGGGGIMGFLSKILGGGGGTGSSISQSEFDVLWSAKGNVFDSPKMFRFAQGVGMLGEAGPEAVMPLKRTAGGDLGVIVAGGGKNAPQAVSVQIINETGQPANVRKSKASFNGQEMVITAWLDGYTRDLFGMRTAMAGRR
jgi:hypothetical protein